MYLNGMAMEFKNRENPDWTLTWDVFKYDNNFDTAGEIAYWTLTWDVFKFYKFC